MDTSLTAAPVATVTDRDRLIGRLAWIGAWCALAIGQLHALARFRTADGKSDLDLPLTRAWADPASDLLSPLITWASPDTVYLTYGKLWLPIFLAFTAAAFVVYRDRRPQRFEKWTWRVVLVAYVGACVCVAGEYWTQWGNGNDALLDAVFLATLPFLVLTMLGSTVLGSTLLVKRYRPTLPAVLLTLTFPGALLITEVTSMGNIVLPIAFAFGLLGRHIAQSPNSVQHPR